jgi:serine/threonine protein kinase
LCDPTKGGKKVAPSVSPRMSNEKAVDESSPEAEALDDDDVAPAYEPKTKPGINADALALSSGQRSKLVLADSIPPPPPDVEVGEEAAPTDIGLEERDLADEGSDPYLGRTLADRYEVLTCLGRGSMGTVYSCRHRVLDKRFAIKIIRQDLARDAEAVSRFVTEAKAASAIGSKHIVEILDFGELPDGAAYIVMEQLEGQTLYQLLADTPRFSISRALGIAIQIADALGAAHAAGVVHRDLKPDNVFLVRSEDEPDFVKILDFGIAKVLRSGSKLTQAGSVMGTPAYMSPEQAMGTATDHRTDIYSLGIMLYEMAAGQVPFDAESPLAVLSMQVSDPPPKLGHRLPEDRLLPPGYEAVVEKCLEKDVENRFQTMFELKAALEEIAEGGVPHLAPSSAPSKPRSRRRPISVTPLFSSVPSHVRSPRPNKWWVVPALGLPALAAAGFFVFRPRPVEVEAPATSAPVVVTPPPPEQRKIEPEEKVEGSTKEVHLILFPLDARVYDGKKDLGMMPVTVKLEPDEVKHLIVARRGYVPRRLIVDGSKSRLVVGLVKEGAERVPTSQAEQEADEAAERAANPAVTAAPKSKAEPEGPAPAAPAEALPAPTPSN